MRSFTFLSLALLLAAAGCGSGGNDSPAATSSRYLDAPLPGGGVGLYVEGTLAREAGDGDRALALLNRSVEADDRLILANQALGEIYRERGDLEQSERWFRRLVSLDPRTARGHFLLGGVLELQERLADALAAYRDGLAIEPQDPEGNLGVGRILLAQDQPAEAVEPLRIGVAARPDDAEATINFGRALTAAGRFDEGESALRRGLELLAADQDRLRNETLLALGLNLARQGRGTEAASLLEEAANALGTPESFKIAGDAHAAVGNGHIATGRPADAGDSFATAVGWYDRAIDLSPGYVAALNAKGAALIRQWQAGGRIDNATRDRALDAWRASLAADPDQPNVTQAIEQYESAGLFE